ncbi:MAG: LysR family transcriptional regulator [Pigmentiphaga sp.]
MSDAAISLRQLKVFLAVAQARNFSRAGEAVGLSQPAVSRAVHELERQLDLRLFDRTTREVVLTEAGQMLAQMLPRWLDELDNTLLELRHWASSRRGKVRVASAPTLSAALMPLCLALSAEREPGLEVVLLDRVQQDVLNSILSGEVDFGVVVEPDAQVARETQCETILHDPFVIVAPAGHCLVQRPPRWTDLAGQRLILLDYVSGSRRLIDAALQRHGVAGRIVQEVGHPTTGFELVRAGLGLSIMPGLAVPESGLPGLAAQPLTPRIERAIMLAHRRNRQPSPLAQCLWRIICECGAEVARRRRQWWG